MNNIVAIANQIPPHVRRGWLVAAMKDGEVLEIQRCWTEGTQRRQALVLGGSFPQAEIVETTVHDVLLYMADLSLPEVRTLLVKGAVA